MAAMIAEVQPESVVGFALVVIVEPSQQACDCGQPENHRVPHVVTSEHDQLLACGMLTEGITQVIASELAAKYDGGEDGAAVDGV